MSAARITAQANMTPLPDRPCPSPCACSWRPATSAGDCGRGDFTRWKEHDAYQKVFDRLPRDLRVEKALADRCSACSPRIAVALCEPRLRIITMCCSSTRGSPVPEPGYGSCRRALSTSTTSSSRPAWPRPSCGWRSSVSSASAYRPSRSGGAKLDRDPYNVCSALAGRRCSGRAPLARQACQSRSAHWHYD